MVAPVGLMSKLPGGENGEIRCLASLWKYDFGCVLLTTAFQGKQKNWTQVVLGRENGWNQSARARINLPCCKTKAGLCGWSLVGKGHTKET